MYSLNQVNTMDSRKPAVFKWEATYYTRERLVHRLALGTIGIIDNVLEHLESDMSATERKSTWAGYYHYYIPMYYLAVIKRGKITQLKVDELMQDIEAEGDRIIKRNQAYKDSRAAERRAQQFKFREGSVPKIHKRHWHRGTYYRIPQLGRVKRNAENIEYKEFIKPSERYKNLPVYDDRTRHIDKSWKTSCKVRKQWEKHIKKHADTIRHEKRVYDIEELDLILDDIAC